MASETSFLIHDIEAILQKNLDASFIEIIDDSHKHAGHNHGGGRHFRITVVAACFEGQGRLERQRRVLDLFKDMIPHPIHALSIRTVSPEEQKT